MQKPSEQISTGSKLQTNAEASAGSISLTVLNPAANNQGVIYEGTSATLNVALTNNTGAGLTLPSGCTLEIYMPSYFSGGEVGNMQITGISQPGWNFSNDSADTSLLLTWGNTSNGTWSAGSNLTFTITTVLCSASPNSDTVQVNFNNLTGSNIPAEVSVTLSLVAPIVPGNVDLRTTLQTDMEFEGQIYVSTVVDPLTNTLFLNLKNTGANPLYNGSAMWQGTPKVIVSFVYGNTSGALAPDDKSTSSEQGSAWSISGSVSGDETDGWSIQNPSASGQANSPSWTLSPTSTNQQIIGTGADANVTFAFDNIFSFTPAGATQMYVQFTGFSQNETTNYNDAIFVLDIYKQPAPDNRGLLSFYSPSMYIYTDLVGTPGPASVNLFWSGFEIDSVTLDYNITGITPAPLPPFSNTYSDTNPLIHDSYTLAVPSVIVGNQLNFALYAYAEDGSTLNSLPFQVTVEQKPGVYTFNGPSTAGFNLNQAASVDLTWKIFAAASIEITCNLPGVASYTTTYDPWNQWNNDLTTITINNLTAPTNTVFTLNAYDKKGKLLNSRTYPVYLNPTGWCDPKDSKVYTIANVNGLVWMTQDYDYVDPSGDSFTYGYDPSYEAQYGRFYPYASALSNAPVGWRMPTDTDWNNLIAIYGAANNGPLMRGGSSGLNLDAGGFYFPEENDFAGMGSSGQYWSQAADPTMLGTLAVDNGQAIVTDLPLINPLVSCCYVRYVKDTDTAITPAAIFQTAQKI